VDYERMLDVMLDVLIAGQGKLNQETKKNKKSVA
jgi:hypothetical protein